MNRQPVPGSKALPAAHPVIALLMRAGVHSMATRPHRWPLTVCRELCLLGVAHAPLQHGRGRRLRFFQVHFQIVQLNSQDMPVVSS